MLCHLHLDHAPLEKRLMRLATRWFNPFQLVANSRFVLEAMRPRPGSSVLVENALDEVFAGLPFQNRFENAGQPWRAAVIGTMRPEKGQDIAIAAFAERPDITLHLIGCEGDGAEGWIAGLKSAATANVRFEGPTTEVAGLIRRLGIQFSLIPSRWPEPFGLAAIESMASSCVTIVSGRGGLGEIAGRTGALVAEDAQELGQALDRLVSLPAAELHALARRQYEAVQHHYAPGRFQEQICRLLSTALRGPSTRLS
jgi:glycosyltransferase involved in cell wall biosynthesis